MKREIQNRITRPFNAATMCGAHKRRARVGCEAPDTTKCFEPLHLCQRRKGHGTDHFGAGKCKFHGGTAPNGQKFAAKEAAVTALEKMGIPVPTDPVQGLLDTVALCAGMVAYLRRRIGEVDAPAVMTAFGPAVDPHVTLLAMWSDRLGKACKMAVDANISERHVRLAEQQGTLIVEILRRALSRSGIPAEQRSAVEKALGVELREHVATLPEGS